jgi:hypothetical protein
LLWELSIATPDTGFASGEVGWFFPEDLIPKNGAEYLGRDGKIHRRVMRGKYRKLRWHTCLMVSRGS